jgi:hypothetical protein
VRGTASLRRHSNLGRRSSRGGSERGRLVGGKGNFCLCSRAVHVSSPRPSFRRAARFLRLAGTGPAWPRLSDTGSETAGGGAAALLLCCLQDSIAWLALGASRSPWRACGRLARFPRIGGLSSARATCSPPTRSRTAATPPNPSEHGHDRDRETAPLRLHRPRRRGDRIAVRPATPSTSRQDSRSLRSDDTRMAGPRARICDGAPSSTLRSVRSRRRGVMCVLGRVQVRSARLGAAVPGGPSRRCVADEPVESVRSGLPALAQTSVGFRRMLPG